MKVYGLRVAVVAVSFLFGILFFFSMGKFYTVYNIEKPLEEKMEELPGIREYEISKQGDTFLITVSLDETEDLPRCYRGIDLAVGEILQGRDFELVLRDNRSDELSDVYYKSQYIIYEAVTRGNFSEMAERVTQEASSIGAMAKLHVDEENVYVHFAKGDSYLNCVVPRGLGEYIANLGLATGVS